MKCTKCNKTFTCGCQKATDPVTKEKLTICKNCYNKR